MSAEIAELLQNLYERKTTLAAVKKFMRQRDKDGELTPKQWNAIEKKLEQNYKHSITSPVCLRAIEKILYPTGVRIIRDRRRVLKTISKLQRQVWMGKLSVPEFEDALWSLTVHSFL